MKAPGKQWLAAVLLTSATIITLLVMSHDRPPPHAPVIIMDRPYVFPSPRIGLLDRLMPAGPRWTWLWKIRYALFGRILTVKINTSIIDLTSLDYSTAKILPTNPEFTDAAGLQAWRLKEQEVRGLRELFRERPDQIVASSRIATGNKVECSIHYGNSVLINGTPQPIGLSMRVLPSIQKGTADLTAIVSFSEAITNMTVEMDKTGPIVIKTNFEFGGRFQLPKEMVGLFIVPAPGSTNQKHLGLLVTADVPQSKK